MNPKGGQVAVQSFDLNSIIGLINQFFAFLGAVVPKAMAIAYFCVIVILLARLLGRNWFARIDNTLLVGSGIVFALASR